MSTKSTDLAVIEDAELHDLVLAAESLTDPEEAHNLMMKARVIATALKEVGARNDQVFLAAKASLLAARKLGRMLDELSSVPYTHRPGPGRPVSQKTAVVRHLGIGELRARDLVRVARLLDADFQRYIQTTGRPPTVNGALTACGVKEPGAKGRRQSDWRRKRRNKAGVRTPANPSFDEGYSLVVRAIGHLSSAKVGPAVQRDISRSIDQLYEVEDRLRPYRGGYVE